tara:strand:+ start:987 stop:3440 length:2454 start_codon:yes stop_codon:yes gene_type:complete
MANNYSAIKIPIPGNVIDTPNAVNGDLLVFSDGKYQNFKPLVVDLRPYTNQHALEFRTSIAGSGSYDVATKRGMLLYSDNETNPGHHLVIASESSQPQFARGAATLDVRGKCSFGSTGSTNILLPDGATRPVLGSFFLTSIDSEGQIKFDTLQNSGVAGGNSYISIIGNTITLNTGGLNEDGALFTAGTGIAIDSGTISQSNTYRPFLISDNKITQDITATSGTAVDVLITGAGTAMAGYLSALKVPFGNVMAANLIARSGAGVSGSVRAANVISEFCTVLQANFPTSAVGGKFISDKYCASSAASISGITRKSKLEFADNRATLYAGTIEDGYVTGAGLSAFIYTAGQDDGFTVADTPSSGLPDVGVSTTNPRDEKGFIELATKSANGAPSTNAVVFTLNDKYYDSEYGKSGLWNSDSESGGVHDQHRRYRADLYANHNTTGGTPNSDKINGVLDFVVGGNIRIKGSWGNALKDGTDHTTEFNRYRGETAAPLHVSGYSYINIFESIRNQNMQTNSQHRAFAIAIDQSVTGHEATNYGDQGGILITTYDSNNDEFAIYCKNACNSSYWQESIDGLSRGVSGPTGNASTFHVKASSGDVYARGNLEVGEGLLVGNQQAISDAGFVGAISSRSARAVSGPSIGIFGHNPVILLSSQPDSANSNEYEAAKIVMTNPDNDDRFGPTGGAGNAAYSTMSARDGWVMTLERSTITSGKLESEKAFYGTKRVCGWRAEVPSGTPAQDWKNEKVYWVWGDTQRDTNLNDIGDGKRLSNFPTGAGSPPAWLDVGGIWIDVGDAASGDSTSFALRIKAGSDGEVSW